MTFLMITRCFLLNIRLENKFAVVFKQHKSTTLLSKFCLNLPSHSAYNSLYLAICRYRHISQNIEKLLKTTGRFQSYDSNVFFNLRSAVVLRCLT